MFATGVVGSRAVGAANVAASLAPRGPDTPKASHSIAAAVGGASHSSDSDGADNTRGGYDSETATDVAKLPRQGAAGTVLEHRGWQPLGHRASFDREREMPGRSEMKSFIERHTKSSLASQSKRR